MQDLRQKNKSLLDRRAFMENLAGLSAGLVVGSAWGNEPTPPTKRPPNIVFLLTDDHRADALGCAGNTIIQTPHLDHLASQGTRFTNAFVTTSICCSSRASILTGQYSRRHGVWDFFQVLSPEQWQTTYPQQLRQAGYYTGFIGKYGIGMEAPVEEFDVWDGYVGQGLYETRDDHDNPIHMTEKIANDMVAFLQNRPSQQPFCLSVSFKAPHVQDGDPRQFIPDPAYDSLYTDVEIPPPRHGSDEVFNAFPEFFRENNEARIRWELRFATPEDYQRSAKNYYRLISGVDAAVGRLLAELQEQNVAENTIVIFTGDNGFFLGEHGLAGKWYGLDESIRVPLLVCDPRLPQAQRGQVCSELALNIDLAPTILDYAGLAIPTEMQGQSLTGLVGGQSTPDNWRQDFLYEHLFEYPAIPPSVGVVSRKHKYLRYPNSQPPYEMLFDLQQDPGETRNLADQEQHHERLQQLRQRCDLLMQQAQ